MILCIGLAADNTFRHGLRALRDHGLPFRAVDLTRLAVSGRVTLPLDDLRSGEFEMGSSVYRLADFDGVWCRLVDVSSAAADPTAAEISAGQYTALCRALSLIDLPVLNPPLRDQSGFTKVLHASAMSEAVGFRTPRSCLTNDPTQAANFARSCPDGVIFKGASACKTWVTALTSEHLELLPRISRLPTLFQERISGPDMRVHIVGDRPVAELITSSAVDYRAVRGQTEYVQVPVPADIAAGCSQLTELIGVPFLGIDFKIDEKTGEAYFLEANSMPCFEGYDFRCGGAISAVIAAWFRDAGVSG